MMIKPYHESEHGVLYHGDCLEIMPMLADKSIDLVLTDPPYGMAYQSNYRTATSQFDKIANDGNVDFLEELIPMCYKLLKDDTHLYMFCNDYHVSSFGKQIEANGFNLKRALVWVKNNHSAGDLYGDYGNKTEFVAFAHKGIRKLNGNRDTNVLMFDRDSCLLHPTQKPISILAYLINKSTNPNQLILDPFAGSGTTAVACINTKRRYILIEMEEKYCDIAAKRIETTLDQTEIEL